MPTNPWSLCFSNNILESPARILFILCFLCTSQLGYLSFFLVCFSPVGHLALCGAVLVVTVVCKDATKQHKAGEPLTTNYHPALDKNPLLLVTDPFQFITGLSGHRPSGIFLPFSVRWSVGGWFCLLPGSFHRVVFSNCKQCRHALEAIGAMTFCISCH